MQLEETQHKPKKHYVKNRAITLYLNTSTTFFNPAILGYENIKFEISRNCSNALLLLRNIPLESDTYFFGQEHALS